MGYLQPSDLQDATVQYLSPWGTQGVDFSQYTAAQLQSLITRASRQIDGYCKQTFALTNAQERYMGRGTNTLRLRRYPLAQIPASVFGGAGVLSQSLVVNTTTTTANGKGDTVVSVADTSNIVAGQYLQWNDNAGENGIAIAGASVPSGPGTITLTSALQSAHASGAQVIVNTVDYVQIVLPGQSFFPIPIQQLVVDAEKGLLINYTPLMFQNLGYATIFPRELPLFVRYTYGYLLGQIPGVLQEVCLEQCRRIVLRSGHLGAGGVRQWRLDDQSVSYADW